MAFNGSGTFNRNTGVYSGSTAWAQTRDGGRKVRADDHDTHDQDIANGLSNCVTKDGQTTITANLPMAGFRHTNCGNAVADTDYATLGQVKGGINVSAAPYSITNTTFSADAVGAYWRLRKSRSATSPTATIVQNNDEIGVIAFAGANGSTYDDCAAIQAAIDGVPGASNDMPGRLVFYTKPDNSGVQTERLRIDSKGKHAITANATSEYALAVVNQSLTNSYGLIVDAARTAYALAVRDSGNQYRHVFNADGSLTIGGAADAIRVTAGGNVGIGTAPSYQLHLSTDSAAKLTTNTWTVTSDARVKTNVQPYTKGLAAIKQVNPVSYDYNGKAGTPVGPGGISILAQDLQPVFPECVGSYKTKLEPGDEKETELLTYQGHAMTFALINAVKELAARVEALEAKT